MLVQIVAGVLVLGVLIFVHELGHFLVAKWGGVAVLEFSIGFGRKIWSKQWGETSYSLGLIPFGGYVRMAGDDPYEVFSEDERKQTDLLQPVAETASSVEIPPQRWFLNKGFIVKSAIVAAGPVANLLLAWVLVFMVFGWYGEDRPVDQPVIGAVMKDMPADKAGLQAGDRVLAINGSKLDSWADLARQIRASGGREVELSVERAGNEQLTLRLSGTPEQEELALLRDDIQRDYLIGIEPTYENLPVNLVNAAYYSTNHIIGITLLTFKSLKLLVQGAISPENIGGPITIVRAAAGSAERGLKSFFLFGAFISVSLAILNLLPIPVLDGGHLLFFVIELVSRRPVNLKIYRFANQLGLMLLLLLMAFAIGNDLFQLVRG